MQYEVSEWKNSVITLESQGKAPKKYGERVLRFSAPMTLEVILPKRDWVLIKSTKQYAYLIPPENTTPPYNINIKTPSHEQAINIAKSCYKNGESWAGQIGEWPAWYMHERKVIINKLIPSEDRASITKEFASELPPQTYLSIGECGVWEIKVSKTTNGFEVHESGLINRANENIQNDIIEGKASIYELTRFERSSQARKACIEHHGTSCKVCNIEFEKVYGKIGANFIHVHHVTPISNQKSEYVIDPINDLVPLCPNCHSMVHQVNPPLPIETLRKLINNKF